MNDDELNRDDETARSLAVLSRLRARFPELFEGGELSLEAVERRLRSAGEAPPQVGGASGESVGPRALEPGIPPTLVPVRDSSRRWEDTRNTLVLGDNLAGLAGLDARGEAVWGAMDMVYLDPPYNTGNAFKAAVAAGSTETLLRLWDCFFFEASPRSTNRACHSWLATRSWQLAARSSQPAARSSQLAARGS